MVSVLTSSEVDRMSSQTKPFFLLPLLAHNIKEKEHRLVGSEAE
jgi:hypothetical protein